jgi:hypothetical protein
MKIYHYTSIDTLALILKTKRIRFSRLDTVDDPEEYQYTDDAMQPAQYTFVSCWTRNAIENIPQWKLYANNQHGVRIGMDEEMFPLFRDCPNPLFEQKENRYLADYNELSKKGYCLMPVLDKYPLYDVVYTDELDQVNHLLYKDDQNVKKVDMKMSGRYKSSCWSFQKECRFIFNLFPIKDVGSTGNGIVLNPNKSVRDTSFDVLLSMKAFHDMDILLGPCVTEAERLIVEALMGRYLNRINYKRSVFTGVVNE